MLTLFFSRQFLFMICLSNHYFIFPNKNNNNNNNSQSSFVSVRPEAKSYYTLTASNLKFSFPKPSILTGVRSNTKCILRMSHATYTYPGSPSPSLIDVSVHLSLSSRVAIIGPNGAGKSTLVKILTGELIPQQGKVDKHPNLRVGYVAQHAFHHLEQHLEKTPNQYIQWRYAGGEDREVRAKATRIISDEDRAQMQQEIDVGGADKRRVEYLVGRQKLKKSYQYEIKWVGMPHKHNSWVPRENLIARGFTKLVQAYDDYEASREGLGYRELSPAVIRQHFEDIGLDGDIADYSEISGLSGGQKVKVVIAAAMWNNPHMLVLDEPTNFLDRDALGGLAVAIRDWGGGVVMVSHNSEFVGALCPETWTVESGKVTSKGKSAVVETAFEDQVTNSSTSSANTTGTTTTASTNGTGTATTTPGSGEPVVKKKKKLTRNQLKERELRRRQRHLRWLADTTGAEKEPDTDSD